MGRNEIRSGLNTVWFRHIFENHFCRLIFGKNVERWLYVVDNSLAVHIVDGIKYPVACSIFVID